ncbi:unnamed protein product [Periconia digitata]|uniref:Uncharacterized protein n=1 Tax=Periconia digitata TaxID=1303443 RepID=A0A9W4U567_9PLEO|nr:unnamed protein product [Periconia digitata]
MIKVLLHRVTTSTIPAASIRTLDVQVLNPLETIDYKHEITPQALKTTILSVSMREKKKEYASSPKTHK